MKYLYDEPFSFYSNGNYRDNYDRVFRKKAKKVELEITTDPCDLMCCPKCGDYTEFDRCIPPNPYYCEECSREILKSDLDPARD